MRKVQASILLLFILIVFGGCNSTATDTFERVPGHYGYKQSVCVIDGKDGYSTLLGNFLYSDNKYYVSLLFDNGNPDEYITEILTIDTDGEIVNRTDINGNSLCLCCFLCRICNEILVSCSDQSTAIHKNSCLDFLNRFQEKIMRTFAWIINEFKGKLRAFLTLIFYAPSICGNAYVVWNLILTGDRYGYLNGMLLRLGIIDEAQLWMQTEKYVLPILIVVQLWLSLGTGFLSFIAGLQTVDKSMYEAAALDGIKNRWQELWYVTLPAMKPQLMFGAVMQITQSFAIADVSLQLAGNPSVNYADRKSVV